MEEKDDQPVGIAESTGAIGKINAGSSKFVRRLDGTDDWMLHPWVYDDLTKYLVEKAAIPVRPSIDMFADKWGCNRLCKSHYSKFNGIGTSSFVRPGGEETLWCNPPYTPAHVTSLLSFLGQVENPCVVILPEWLC